MHIKPHEVHIWTAHLDSIKFEHKQFSVLSPDELERANRFKFSIHRQRFIIARLILRCILSKYLHTPAAEIQFAYIHKKPHIQLPKDTNLQFNLSHSVDIAVYAFTSHHDIGIDIEQIQDTFNAAVAKRYFSHEENLSFAKLTSEEQIVAFYRLWSRKEALIKACGKGLSIPLSSFSVSVHDVEEQIDLENQRWTLIPLNLVDGYQSALATNQKVDKLLFWNFFDHNQLI